MSSTISAGGAPSPEETVVMERSRAARILDWRPASALARIVIVLCLVIPLLLAATFMWVKGQKVCLARRVAWGLDLAFLDAD